MVLSSVVAMANTEEIQIDATCLAENYIVEESIMMGPRQITMVSPDSGLNPIGGRDVLWDNGDTDGTNGWSNADAGAIGFQRTCLDDFVVPAGEEWTITDFHSFQLWNTYPIGSGTDYLLSFWSDNAGTPGTIFATAVTVSYAEIATGRTWFGRLEYETDYVFEPIVLTEGTYWIEGNVIGPENNFWMIHASPIIGAEAWVNYEDLGGLQSGTTQFGAPAGMSFTLTGTSGGGGGVVWDNGMDFLNLGASQYMEGGLDAYCADDFVFTEETVVNDIHWGGGYWNGDPVGYPWGIAIMYDDGTGNAPDSHPQTPSIAGYVFTDAECNPIDLGGGYFEYSVVLPADLTFPQGKYWISIWGIGATMPQTGWGYHDTILEHMGVFGSDYFSFPFWTNTIDVFGAAYDFAFQLTYEDEPEPEASIDVEKYVYVPGEGPCDYSICLEDTYGDGWGTGYLDVYVNGVVVLSGITCPVAGPDCYDFLVDDGDLIEVYYWTPDPWSYENYFYVKDCDGNVVADAWGEDPTDPEPEIIHTVSLGEWVDADEEGDAVDFEICSIVEYKIVVHNDGEVPIYDIYVYDQMSIESLEFVDADPFPDYIDGNYMEWYGGMSIPYELYPCESFEIHVWAHVVGPHCSIDSNWAGADAFCDVEPFIVFDEDYAWIHCVDPDTTPPVTVIEIDGDVGDNGWYIGDVTITITATDDISGVAITYYSLDGGAFEEYTGPITVSDDGEYTIAAYSIDNAGNIEDPPVEDAFGIDQTVPTIVLTWDEENSKLIADVDDATSGVAQVEFFVNSESIGVVTEAPFEMEYDASSGDTGYAIVTDNAGNSAQSEEIVSSNELNQQSNPVLRRRI